MKTISLDFLLKPFRVYGSFRFRTSTFPLVIELHRIANDVSVKIVPFPGVRNISYTVCVYNLGLWQIIRVRMIKSRRANKVWIKYEF